MTRKDYILIAAAIRELLADIERESGPMVVCDRTRALMAGETVRHAALRLADTLAADNPRFDRALFLRACSLSA